MTGVQGILMILIIYLVSFKFTFTQCYFIFFLPAFPTIFGNILTKINREYKICRHICI
jgi:hypothetical protein